MYMKSLFGVSMATMMLSLVACSSGPEKHDLPVLRATGLLDTQAEREAKAAKRAKKRKVKALLKGSPIDRVAAYGLESDDPETRKMLAELLIEDSTLRSKRWLEAALTAFSRGENKLFRDLATDALEMQLEPASLQGSLTTDGSLEFEWRVIPNVALFGNPKLDNAVKDFAAPKLGIDDGSERQRDRVFSEGFIRSQTKVSEDCQIIEGRHGTLVVDYAETLRGIQRLIDRERDETLHFQISATFYRINSKDRDLNKKLYKSPGLQPLTIEEFDQITKQYEGKDVVEKLSAPRLTVLPGQLANVTISNQLSFVEAFDRKVYTKDGGVRIIASPRVGVVRDGLVFESRVAAIDEKSVFGHFTFEIATIQRPIPEFVTKTGGVEVTYQIPQVNRGEQSVTSVLEVGKRYISPPMRSVVEKEDGRRVNEVRPVFVVYEVKRINAKDAE